MINSKLYYELQRVLGKVKIGSPNLPGAYIKPKVQGRFYKAKETSFLDVTEWGETYAVNCPVCNDKRQRLCFSHMHGCYTEQHGKRRWYIGHLVTCYNEGCHKRHAVTKRSRLDKYLRQLQNIKVCMDGFDAKATHQKKNLWEVAPTDIVMPPESVAITHPQVPGHVVAYLEGRGFDAYELFETYGLRYVPQGSLKYPHSLKEIKELEDQGTPPDYFQDERILIPIRFRRCLVGWQARKVGYQHDGSNKYIFNDGAVKNEWLYNFDQAVFAQDVLIVEGITDVWALGSQAIAPFGKGLSVAHLEFLKIVFSYDGCGWIIPDENDPDALKKAKETCKLANKKGVFAHGCHIITGILEGTDPAKFVEQHGREALWNLLEEKGVHIHAKKAA